ncbi:MAG: hypothetical protein VCD00_19150 [Candidatus Hydrogenedentota bacterium]
MKKSLISMLRQLMEDMAVLHQQGAGYYSCIPIIRRYNKLLGQSRTLFDANDSLMGTFDNQEEADPKDPAEKMKIVQATRIETGQLISLLESCDADDDDEAAVEQEAS